LTEVRDAEEETPFFWIDGWLLGQRIVDLAPEVCAILVLKRIANKRTVQNAFTSHSWVSHIQGRHEHGSKIKIAYSLGQHQGGGLAAWSSQHPYLPPSNDQYLARSVYMNFFQGMHSFVLSDLP
jgi:hypothetical protein